MIECAPMITKSSLLALNLSQSREQQEPGPRRDKEGTPIAQTDLFTTRQARIPGRNCRRFYNVPPPRLFTSRWVCDKFVGGTRQISPDSALLPEFLPATAELT